MEPEGIIGLLQTSVVLAVMASGAICDWRTRRVPDAHWLILCVIGLYVTNRIRENGQCFAS